MSIRLIRKTENAARSPMCLNPDFQDFMITMVRTVFKNLGVTHLDFKILILLIAICAMHNDSPLKINRLIFQLRKS